MPNPPAVSRWPWPLAVTCAFVALLAAPVRAQGRPVGFAETFALAGDRGATLQRLVPGTEEHFLYACLLAQHERRFGDVPPLLRAWIERYGRTAGAIEIENRQALLTYERDPEATFAFLRERLALTFDQQRQLPGADPELPTRLDAALLAPGALARRALERHPGTVDGFGPGGLWDFAAAGQVDDALLTPLLAALDRVDVPNLPALVARQLALRGAGGFGTLAIHRQLLREQLEELARLRPQLLTEAAFVETWLRRLQPGADVDWRRDPAAREAYLTELEAFVARLAPVHDALKVHVLHHRLAHDLAQGLTDRDRLLAYLRLPRDRSYVEPRLLRDAAARGAGIVRTGDRFPTGLPPVGDDEELVRSHLERLFVDAGSYDAFAGLVREDWLRRVFAETKILAGVGDQQRWYAMLDDPAYYERLRDRVEVRFAATAPESFDVRAPVVLPIETKNVDRLIVRVFEIDTFNYLRDRDAEVDGSIELDGLVANDERTIGYSDPPLRRVAREIPIPSIDQRRGVWVVELIGNGIASRTVVRKGALRCVDRIVAAGHAFRVFDETGRPRPTASLWFGGRDYAPDDSGEIRVPFSTDPGSKTVILRDGGFASLARFTHRREEYQLDPGIFVARESLIAGGTARVVLQPRLTVCGAPISVRHLQDVVLQVVATDLDGVASSQDVRDLELRDGADTVHELRVPARLATLKLSLSARIPSLSLGEPADLTPAAVELAVNGIDRGACTTAPLLGRTPAGYALDLLGKDGEPKPSRAVELTLTLRDFRDPLAVTLRSDARGRVELGSLDGVERVDVRGADNLLPLSFAPDGAARTLPELVQGRAGDVLRIPWPASAGGLRRGEVSLLELRGGEPAYDRFERLSLAGGFVELRGLAAGDYALRFARGGGSVRVRVTQGTAADGFVVGAARCLQAASGELLQITGLEVAAGELVVRLANAGAPARVRVHASRWLPAFAPADALLDRRAPSPAAFAVGGPDASYVAARPLGDEARYILERRFARHFPGNMLERPGLVLNPWALEESTSEQWNAAVGLGGGAGGRHGGRGGGRRPSETGGPAPAGTAPADLDFLGRPAPVLVDLRPDADGVVRVPLAALGSGQLVHVVATDDVSAVYEQLALPERPLEPVSTRLTSALDPARAFVQRRRIEFVAAGAEVTIADARGADVELYDSLASVFRLFRTVGGDAELDRFEFLLRWPSLDAAQKRALYSEHACHELHVFLHQKDPEFFAAVVRPYLANKLHKQLVDHWLLGDDLSGYLDPWEFARLNVVERVLLARTIVERLPGVQRRIRDELALTPVTPAELDTLVRYAFKGGALYGDTGIVTALGRLQGELAAGRPEQQPQEGAEPPPRPVRRFAGTEPAETKDQEDAFGEEVAAPEEKEVAERKVAFEREVEERAGVSALFRSPARTRRYVESDYWRVRIEDQTAELVQPNAFWLDFATADPAQPFVSPNLVFAARGNHTEALLALAFLDLPFEAGQHETAADGARFTIRAASPLLLVLQELATAGPAEDGAAVLVSQNVYRLDEPYRTVDGQRVDAWVTGELLTDVAYGARVVVTNPTSAQRDVEVLLQIPAGAIPVAVGPDQPGFATRSVPLRLRAYGTQALSYAFYFPAAGASQHHPACVTTAGRVLAVASGAETSWDVRVEPSRVDVTSFGHVSQQGTAAEVLDYLQRANLLELDLGRIAWRMRDRASFDAVLALLRQRQVFAPELWSFGIFHRDPTATREYLQQADAFVAQCGIALSSPLLTVDPVARRTWQLTEFRPLFNARAHRTGGEPRIFNAAVADDYDTLLQILARKPRLDGEDRAVVTCFLLLQDRISDALDMFAQIDPAELPARLQYDYLSVYVDFFRDDRASARAIAERYREHPVTRWRDAFREALAQLDEADGLVAQAGAGDGATGRAATPADREPMLDLQVEGQRLILRYANVDTVELGYYLMDVEFLFSAHPFVQQDADSFALVRPNRSNVLRQLPPDRSRVEFDLPDDLRNANLLVEARAAGVVRRATRYASSLAVRWIENRGQLQVADAETGRPLPAVYVKVFARLGDGTVRFHKDGYTDLRGRFDYMSVSADGAMEVERLAVLVLSDDRGTVSRELDPPAR
ncbi:MAG: hypothetical protein IPM29_09065 [Planctomycetes bacterium]|nr:hypothetical protein [Planctomycetota bacterium]